jgi:hypothetical protein
MLSIIGELDHLAARTYRVSGGYMAPISGRFAQCGTAIIAHRWADHVFIAVDSRSRNIGAKEGDIGTTADKIVQHPTMPLVVTIAGLGGLASVPKRNSEDVPNFRPTVEFVEQCLLGFNSESGLTNDLICERLIRTLHDRVINTYTYADTEVLRENSKLTLVLGMAGNMGVELRRIELCPFWLNGPTSEPSVWFYPDWLQGFAQPRSQTLPERLSILETPEEIAGVLVDEIAGLIDAETSVQVPHLRSCGWPVQVAVIQQSGVRRGNRGGRESQLEWR